MEKLNFKISIDAPKEKVWEKLWSSQTYPEWTRPFGEGSQAYSEDWNEGSRVLFTAADGYGMYSDIVKKRENEFMSFEHIGMIKDGKQLPIDDETKKWSGSMENYTLTESGGKTEVEVVLDIMESEVDSMNKTFPKALEVLKRISEE